MRRTYGVIAACAGSPGRWRGCRFACGSLWPSPGSSPCCCWWRVSSSRVSSSATSTARSPMLSAHRQRTSRRWSKPGGSRCGPGQRGTLRAGLRRRRRAARVDQPRAPDPVARACRVAAGRPAATDGRAQTAQRDRRAPAGHSRPAGNGERAVVVIGDSLSERDSSLASLNRLLLIALPLALLVAAFAGYEVAGAALRPVERMRSRAAAISESNPSERLPVPEARDEIGALGRTLNEMLDRLEAGFARERRLVSDASHELRTPLTTMRAELELALRGERDAGELRAAIASAHEETRRMSSLADDLLVLARADQGRLPLQPEPTAARALLDAAARARRGRIRAGRPLDRRARGRCRGRAGPGRPESRGAGSRQPDRQLARVRRRPRGAGRRPRPGKWSSCTCWIAAPASATSSSIARSSASAATPAARAPRAQDSAWQSSRRSPAPTAAASARATGPVAAPTCG